MNVLPKTALAMSFSILGVLSSVSALAMVSDTEHQLHEIEIIADEAKDIRVFTTINDEFTEIDIPVDELTDSESLEEALSMLPEQIRETIVNNLSEIHTKGKVIKVKEFIDGSVHNGLDSEHVVVMSSDGDVKVKDKLYKVIQSFSGGDKKVKVFKFDHNKQSSASSVIGLLNKGEFSQDDLDKIQQALDAKR